jgi:ElaB/YqjD/DUF883 family membrane-anchored ribosome-binding protein
MDKQFAQALNEMKAELQELYEALDSELRNTDNQDLIDDSYHNVTSKLETALSEFDSLIADVDNGLYDDNIFDIDDEMLEVEE